MLLCLYVCPSIALLLSVALSVCRSVGLSVALSVALSIALFPVCVSVGLSVYLAILLYLYLRVFADVFSTLPVSVLVGKPRKGLPGTSKPVTGSCTAHEDTNNNDENIDKSNGREVKSNDCFSLPFSCVHATL